MDKGQVYKIVKGFILFIFGLIDLALLVRILLKLIGASTKSSFVKFWYDLSNPLHAPFDGTIRDLASESIVVELNSVIAVFIWATLALFALRVVEGIFKDSFKDKLQSLFDTFFKVAETILGLRLFFRLIGANKSTFISLLYGISSPFYEPFKGILPTIGSGKVVFETSTFIAIIIFIIFDIASEKLFSELGKHDAGIGNKPKKQAPNPPQQQYSNVQTQNTQQVPAQNAYTQQNQPPTQQQPVQQPVQQTQNQP